MEEISNKQQAQRQADRVREFRQLLDRLEKKGVLTLSMDQRRRVDEHLDQTLEALAKRFDIDLTESQRQISLGMRVISALGGLALCIAVFLFFNRIWGLVTTPVQVAILIAIPLVLLAATEFAAEREQTLYFASLFSLVALLCSAGNPRRNPPAAPLCFRDLRREEQQICRDLVLWESIRALDRHVPRHVARAPGREAPTVSAAI